MQDFLWLFYSSCCLQVLVSSQVPPVFLARCFILLLVELLQELHTDNAADPYDDQHESAPVENPQATDGNYSDSFPA